MIRAIVILFSENSASSDIRYMIQGSSLKENALQMSDLKKIYKQKVGFLKVNHPKVIFLILVMSIKKEVETCIAFPYQPVQLFGKFSFLRKELVIGSQVTSKGIVVKLFDRSCLLFLLSNWYFVLSFDSYCSCRANHWKISIAVVAN